MVCARPGLLLFGILGLSAQSLPERQQPKPPATRIMMLYAHDPNAPGVRGFSREMQKLLRSQLAQPLEVYDELLDSDRFGNRENWEQFAKYITNKYRGFRIDAVVAHGSMALQFAMDKLGAVFPDVPIVYGAAFEPVVDFTALPANVTGRRILLPFAETFKLARSLQPDAERVVIVTGASAMDSVLAATAVNDLTPLLGGLQLELLKDWSYPSLIQSLRALPEHTFVILSSFRQDWRGQTFNSGDLIPTITRAAAVPVYGIAENWVGDGIVGGGSMPLVSEGARTGQLLMRVLRRTSGARLPGQEVAVNETVVDWRQLQRWGLAEKRLPAGTRVLYRPPSTWERYKTAILVFLAVIAVQAVLITLLMLERSARARAARALVESRSQVAHIARVATLGQLGAAVTHEIRQPLTAIRVHAETGALLLAQEPPDVGEAHAVFRDIVSANARAVDVIDHVRLLLRKETGESAPISLNDVCRSAIKLLQREAETRRVTIAFSLADRVPTIIGDAVQLQQVVINLVLNAIEAAATSQGERRVVVSTAERGVRIELVVSDSGPGFPPQAEQHLFETFYSTKKNGLGMGLAIVQQIIELHHGQVRAENAPGGGALFRVTFPAESAGVQRSQTASLVTANGDERRG